MNRLAVVGFLSVLSFPASAQHVPVINTGPRMPVPATGYKYGNILFPGGIHQSHPQRVGRTVSGIQPPYGGIPHGGRDDRRRGRTVVVPYAFPFFMGGYGYQQPPAPTNVTVVVPPQPTPSVVINHNYTPETAAGDSDLPEQSGVRSYEAPKPPSPAEPEKPAAKQVQRTAGDDDRPTIYLVALTDGSVQSAIGYWLEDDALHYVTPRGSVNRVSVDRIDRDTTQQLNTERNVEFDLKFD